VCPKLLGKTGQRAWIQIIKKTKKKNGPFTAPLRPEAAVRSTKCTTVDAPTLPSQPPGIMMASPTGKAAMAAQSLRTTSCSAAVSLISAVLRSMQALSKGRPDSSLRRSLCVLCVW
jgi:hypothetical protein